MPKNSNALIDYRIYWKSKTAFPGSHASRQAGAGQMFYRLSPFLQHPDPRHLDLRRNALDIYQQCWVKRYQQRSQINVYLIADASSSMRFYGSFDKKQFILQFAECLANSVLAYGDRFGFIACQQARQPSVLLNATRSKGAIDQALLEFRRLNSVGTSAEGLPLSHQYCGKQMALIFFISDFYLEDSLLSQTLAGLSQHAIVPVILRDPAEAENLPDRGFLRLRDPETRQLRTLFMRPALKEKIITQHNQQRRRMASCFNQFGCRPLLLQSEFDAAKITAYFHDH